MFLGLMFDLGVVGRGFNPGRITMSLEKLCPVHRGFMSSSMTWFTPRYQDILYTQEFSGERSTAVERSPLRSISCTRVRQK